MTALQLPDLGWRVVVAGAWLTACSVYTLPSGGPTAGESAEAATSEAGAGSSSGGDVGGHASGGTLTASAGTQTTSVSGTGGASVSGTPEPTSAAGAAGAANAAGAAGSSLDPSAGAGPDSGAAGAPAVEVSYRYVKLLALSEQAGNVWSSVAELQVLTTGGALIPRQGWTITADSEELSLEQAAAKYAIDGDAATYWHTHWQWAPNNVNDPPLPHYVIVDLGVAQPITGFSYLPRQNKANGRIGDWEFYVSQNGTDWGTPVKAGTFPAGAALQTINF